MATMQEIEQLAAKMAAVRDALTGTWMAQQEERAEVDRKYLPRLRKLTADFKASLANMVAAVSASPELFAKPRSVILHGIKAGFQKGKGKIEWEDDQKLIARIEKQFDEGEAELLIKTTKKPIASALSDLDIATLKKLGITVEETGDVAFVKLADGDVAKMIKALLKGGDEDES